MLLSTWLTGRQARELMRDGRLDAARQLLTPLAQSGHRRAFTLLRELAQCHLDRAAGHQLAGCPEDAWDDLAAAEKLVPGAAERSSLRDALTRQGLNSAADLLALGHPLRALHACERLQERGVKSPGLAALSDAATAWLSAAALADEGEFDAALRLVRPARDRLSDTARAGLDSLECDFARRQARHGETLAEFTRAAAAGDWPAVVRLGQVLLPLAPDHSEVRDLQALAWARLQQSPAKLAPANGTPRAAPPFAASRLAPDSLVQPTPPVGVPSAQLAETLYFDGPPISESGPVSRRGSVYQSAAPHAPGSPLPKRFLLWMDGVGGYLVCLSPRLTLGQAVGETIVDVPVFAELARLHAEIHRDTDGGYVLEAARDAFLNGRPATRAILTHGDRITLGTSCQFVFHKPVAISATARLDVVSGHRLPWAVNGIMLMDQTLVVGCEGQAHLCWGEDTDLKAILHRTDTGLALKCPGHFRVDSRPCVDRAELPLPAVVTSERFSFALDPVGPRV